MKERIKRTGSSFQGKGHNLEDAQKGNKIGGKKKGQKAERESSLRRGRWGKKGGKSEKTQGRDRERTCSRGASVGPIYNGGGQLQGTGGVQRTGKRNL